jgi:integrase
MPRVSTPLTATQIKNLKPQKTAYIKSDGGGMYLEVMPSGLKRWRIRYKYNGKMFKKGLGTYPDVSLADARMRRAEIKRDLAAGVDPFAVVEVVETITARTFKYIAEKYINDQKLSESYRATLEKIFKRNVYPVIGDKPANEVTAADIGDVVLPMMKRGAPSLAKKTFYIISKVFRVTISADLLKRVDDAITVNPCSALDAGTLFNDIQKAHYPIITESKQLAALIDNIKSYPGDAATRLGLLFVVYTAVRPGNARLAEWGEIQGNKWVIPAHKMKAKNSPDHIVPLSKQALSILSDAKKLGGDPFIFPSPRGKRQPLSDAAFVAMLRRLGYTKDEVVAHSFRGIFSTISHEKNQNHHAIELILAHSFGNSVSQAYNRSEKLEERGEILQWYANYLDNC